MREHLTAEEVDILQAQLVRHRAEMQKCEQMPDAQPLDALDQLVAHGRSTAGDQKSAFDKVLVFELPQIEALTQRGLQGLHQARVVLVTGDRLVVLGV